MSSENDIIARLERAAAVPMSDYEAIEDGIQEIKRLRLERDKARIMYCDKLSPIDPHKVAEKWRWNCFAHDKETWVEALDRLAELERENELQ